MFNLSKASNFRYEIRLLLFSAHITKTHEIINLVQLVYRIRTRLTRAFKPVPTCHIGSAVHFTYWGLLAFECHSTMKMDSWIYVTCGYSFESSCQPGADSGNQINAHITLMSCKSVSMCALLFAFKKMSFWTQTSVLHKDDIVISLQILPLKIKGQDYDSVPRQIATESLKLGLWVQYISTFFNRQSQLLCKRAMGLFLKVKPFFITLVYMCCMQRKKQKMHWKCNYGETCVRIFSLKRYIWLFYRNYLRVYLEMTCTASPHGFDFKK